MATSASRFGRAGELDGVPAVAAVVPAAPESATRASAAAEVTLLSECALAVVAVGTPVRVVNLQLEEDLGEWLRAVGICEGECLIVLRRAAFGGPVHVRTRSGGEFALNRSLAQSIVVSVLPNAPEKARLENAHDDDKARDA